MPPPPTVPLKGRRHEVRTGAKGPGCYGGSRASLGAERALARQGRKGRTAARTAPGSARSRGDGPKAPASRASPTLCLLLSYCPTRVRSSVQASRPVASTHQFHRPFAHTAPSAVHEQGFVSPSGCLARNPTLGRRKFVRELLRFFEAQRGKSSHRSHFLQDPFCYSRPNLPAPINRGALACRPRDRRSRHR